MKTTRLNSLSVYASCGTLAGMAARHGDGARARQLSAWANHAIRLENDPAYEREARAQFNWGYREARGGVR